MNRRIFTEVGPELWDSGRRVFTIVPSAASVSKTVTPVDTHTTALCEWLHQRLDALPMFSYPFDVEALPSNGIYFFYENGESISFMKTENTAVMTQEN
jgi:hypothetical protein